MNDIFLKRIKEYFNNDYEHYIKLLDEPYTQGFFLNTNKASKDEILEIIDFEYKESDLTSVSFYHQIDNIGKTKAYELGLIYPQEIAASIPATKINDLSINLVVDMCSAPGGKSINVMNKVSSDVLFVCNDVNHTRALTLSSNLERLGLDNVIVTCKSIDSLTSNLFGCADLVILDAPCSGEGIIRKYPEIIDNYSISNIESLANTQSYLLENAYKMLKKDGYILYSTCTYAFEEDEYQIQDFLKKHDDIELVDLGEGFASKLKGTIKLSPLNNTEGQFICLLKKNSESEHINIKYLKSIKESLVDKFINDNFNINNYYLYKYNNRYYLSFMPLIDLKNDVLRYGIYVGEIKNNRFEPSHNLYRSNLLIGKYKYVYDLSDNEYEKYVLGLQINISKENHYYLLTYKGHSLGYGKCSNGQLKNKYPKGLRTK